MANFSGVGKLLKDFIISTLTTTAKTIPGAINELKTAVDGLNTKISSQKLKSESIDLEPNTTKALPLSITARAIIIAQISNHAAMYAVYGASSPSGSGSATISEIMNNNNYFSCFRNSNGQIGIGNSNTSVSQRITVFYL